MLMPCNCNHSCISAHQQMIISIFSKLFRWDKCQTWDLRSGISQICWILVTGRNTGLLTIGTTPSLLRLYHEPTICRISWISKVSPNLSSYVFYEGSVPKFCLCKIRIKATSVSNRCHLVCGSLLTYIYVSLSHDSLNLFSTLLFLWVVWVILLSTFLDSFTEQITFKWDIFLKERFVCTDVCGQKIVELKHRITFGISQIYIN